MLKSEFVDIIKRFKKFNDNGMQSDAEELLVFLSEDLGYIEYLISMIPDSELDSFSSAQSLW